MKPIRDAMRGDDGLSVAEVVVAAAILFFVLTAMVGLIGASQRMSVMAKDRTTLTNAVAEHIDRIRALDYYTIATPPGGVVPSVENVAYGPYTIRFTNRVVMPDGANGEFLRTVYVTARTSIRGNNYRTSAVVHIKNPKNDTTAASITDPDGPTIEFKDSATGQNAVLYGTNEYPGGYSTELSTEARSESDLIVNVKYLVGTTLVRDRAGTLGTDANFDISPGQANADTATEWDTTQTGVNDGLQKVVVQATDSRGRSATTERQFIVDNVAPGTPGMPAVAGQTSVLTRLNAAAAADPPVATGQTPTSYAVAYRVYTYEEYKNAYGDPAWALHASGDVNAGASFLDAMHNAGPIPVQVATAPFSRYSTSVRGLSPRGLISGRVRLRWISPPEVYSAGTQLSRCTTEYVKSGSTSTTTYALTVYITKPTFVIDEGATTFHLRVKDSATGGWADVSPVSAPVVTTEGSYWKVDVTYRDAAAAKSLWFKVGANVTPLGTGGGAPAGAVFSNAVGTSPLDTDRRSGTAVTATMNPDTTWQQ